MRYRTRWIEVLTHSTRFSFKIGRRGPPVGDVGSNVLSEAQAELESGATSSIGLEANSFRWKSILWWKMSLYICKFNSSVWNEQSLRSHTFHLRLLDIVYEARRDLFSNKYNWFRMDLISSTFQKDYKFFFTVRTPTRADRIRSDTNPLGSGSSPEMLDPTGSNTNTNWIYKWNEMCPAKKCL